MLCFRYKKLLMPYTENALDERTRKRVTLHVSRCKRCADELRVLESMSQALRQVDVTPAEPAQDLWAKVSARIADENIQSVSSRRSWVQKTAAAGFFAVIIAVGVILTNPSIMVEKPQSLSSRVNDMSGKRVAINEPEPGAKQNITIASGAPTAVDDARRKLTKPPRQKPVMMASLPPEERKLSYPDIKSDINSRNAEKTNEDIKLYTAASPAQHPASPAAFDVSKSAPVAEAMPNAPSISYYNDAGGALNDTSPAAKADDGLSTKQQVFDFNLQVGPGNAKGNTIVTGADSEGKEAERSRLSHYKRTVNYTEMVRSASRLIRLDPGNAPYYYTDLGFAYAHLGNNAESMRMYSYALDYGNSDTWPVTAASIKNAGMLPRLKDQYADKYRTKNEPLIGTILLELQSVGDDTSAMMNAVRKLLKADSDNPHYLLKLGEAYERCGNKREARTAYERIASGSDAKYASIAKLRIAAMSK